MKLRKGLLYIGIWCVMSLALVACLLIVAFTALEHIAAPRWAVR
jgi:hypothetical protein